MSKHLAIFAPSYIEKILTGEKTVEGRFSQPKIAPFETVKKGDIIFLKESGGKVLGQAEVDNVLYYENLDGETLGKIRREYQGDFMVDDKFWEAHAKARFATIIFLKKPERFISSPPLRKRDRRPWVVLEN